MRKCGDEVREILHDGSGGMSGRCALRIRQCIHFARERGFFHGAALPDPVRLLQGTGEFIRHVKLRPGTAADAASLSRLIEMAYSDIKASVESG